MLGAPDKLSWKSDQKSNQRFQKVGNSFDSTLFQKLDGCANYFGQNNYEKRTVSKLLSQENAEARKNKLGSGFPSFWTEGACYIR